MYAQPVPTLHGLHIAVWPLLLLSVRPLYHANKWLEHEEENFDEADEGETHAESKHPPNVCNESCGRHHLKEE